MTEDDEAGFLTALGQEFCWALSPPVPDDLIIPQDGYEVWLRAFGTRPSPATLVALTNGDVDRLRMACVEHFECPAVLSAQVRLAVSRTLTRWPPGGD